MGVPVLPESAPFTAEQRAWLNGLFAGLLSLEGVVTDGAATGLAVALVEPSTMLDAGSQAVEGAEETPWHDPTLSLEERLALAQDRPLPLQLMSAMAQLDCGTCGYTCKTYAAAIVNGTETNLTKCTPGGRETAKKLKEIMAKAAGA